MRSITPLLLLLLAGCTKKTASLKDVLPIEVQRTWTLKSTQAAAPPASISERGVENAIVARYEGNGAIDVALYEMKVEASAFELQQRWRQADGLAASAGKYFIVAIPVGPDLATCASFLQELRQNLLKPPK